MKEIDDLHIPFKKWLKDNRIPYIYARPDRPSGINLGHPDFTILWMGGNISIEFKTPTGKLSHNQIERIKYLQASGNTVAVCRSIEEAISAIPWAGVTAPQHGGPYRKQFQTMRAAVESTVAAANGEKAVQLAADRPDKPPFVVMRFGGQEQVYALGVDGGYRKVRVASPADLINFPRFDTDK